MNADLLAEVLGAIATKAKPGETIDLVQALALKPTIVESGWAQFTKRDENRLEFRGDIVIQLEEQGEPLRISGTVLFVYQPKE